MKPFLCVLSTLRVCPNQFKTAVSYSLQFNPAIPDEFTILLLESPWSIFFENLKCSRVNVLDAQPASGIGAFQILALPSIAWAAIQKSETNEIPDL